MPQNVQMVQPTLIRKNECVLPVNEVISFNHCSTPFGGVLSWADIQKRSFMITFTLIRFNNRGQIRNMPIHK
jgi:hypothetical protein